MLWKNLPNHNQEPNIVVNANEKKPKQLLAFLPSVFRLITAMALGNIQGYYKSRTVVSALSLLCKVTTVQFVSVLFLWLFFS